MTRFVRSFGSNPAARAAGSDAYGRASRGSARAGRRSRRAARRRIASRVASGGSAASCSWWATPPPCASGRRRPWRLGQPASWSSTGVARRGRGRRVGRARAPAAQRRGRAGRDPWIRARIGMGPAWRPRVGIREGRVRCGPDRRRRIRSAGPVQGVRPLDRDEPGLLVGVGGDGHARSVLPAGREGVGHRLQAHEHLVDDDRIERLVEPGRGRGPTCGSRRRRA